MYLKVLEITPTCPLTFRKVPLSHKRIESYNFIPPTTLSGFLYRLLKLSKGEEIPIPKWFKGENPDINEYYLLETKLEKPPISLGGYPLQRRSSIFESYRMGYQHIGKGHSISDGLDVFDPSFEKVMEILIERVDRGILDRSNIDEFKKEYQRSNHNKFYLRAIYKRLIRGEDLYKCKYSTFKKEERRQPLDWNYCSSPSFYGILVSESKGSLDILDSTYNYGFKIGKEGFAFISNVCPTLELENSFGEFVSSTIIPAAHPEVELKNVPGIESVYYFDRSHQKFRHDVFAIHGTVAEGAFYTASIQELSINIPKIMIELLKEAFHV